MRSPRPPPPARRLVRHGRAEALSRPGRDRDGPRRGRAARGRRRGGDDASARGPCDGAAGDGEARLPRPRRPLGPDPGDLRHAVTGELDVHLGDVVGVVGRPAKSRRGEPSVLAESVEVLSRNTQPLPDTFHGLTDVELRYRKRYLDLLMNEETRETFVTRAKVVTAIRRALDEWGFVEVETPILQPRYGGAFARPFVTHSQRARRRLLPPHRDRAVPQAADRRRARARLRDRQGLPQRGRLVQAQPGVHACSSGTRRTPTTRTR